MRPNGLGPLKLSSGYESSTGRLKVTIKTSVLRWLAGTGNGVYRARSAAAQDPIPIDREPASINGARRFPTRPVRGAGTGLPIWHYQVVSPVDGASYSGYMVGSDPFLRGARTITVPVILCPSHLSSSANTMHGFTTTFDPSTAPDAGCTAGQTAMSLVENSPIFQNYSWTLNGVDVGVTQYIDAFRFRTYRIPEMIIIRC